MVKIIAEIGVNHNGDVGLAKEMIAAAAACGADHAKFQIFDPKAIVGFAMTLSEVCQNIIEHAGRGGWVMVQTYKWAKRLGRRVVVIAVCDAGLGFRKSLESISRSLSLVQRSHIFGCLFPPTPPSMSLS